MLKDATDSAKNTIVSQNNHITEQDQSIQHLKKRLQSKENEFCKQVDMFHEENDNLQSQLKRCFHLPPESCLQEQGVKLSFAKNALPVRQEAIHIKGESRK